MVLDRRRWRRWRVGRALAATGAVVAVVVLSSGCGGHGEAVTPVSPTSGASGTPSSSTPVPTPTPTPSPTTARPTTATPTPSSPTPTSTALPPALAGHVITRIPTTQRVVALTFDGGSGAQGAASVLATLDRTGVRATFFLTGRFAQTYPQTARSIATRGVVGNHTMTHPHLTQLSSSAVGTEVSQAEATLHATIGRAAKPWFRFPYGEQDARTLGLVNGFGYAAVGWTVDTLGWEGRSGAGGVPDIVARVLAKLQPGEIVLMHLGAAPDGTTLDADALPNLIAAIRGAGYSFVTVDAMR